MSRATPCLGRGQPLESSAGLRAGPTDLTGNETDPLAGMKAAESDEARSARILADLEAMNEANRAAIAEAEAEAERLRQGISEMARELHAMKTALAFDTQGEA